MVISEFLSEFALNGLEICTHLAPLSSVLVYMAVSVILCGVLFFACLPESDSDFVQF